MLALRYPIQFYCIHVYIYLLRCNCVCTKKKMISKNEMDAIDTNRGQNNLSLHFSCSIFIEKKSRNMYNNSMYSLTRGYSANEHKDRRPRRVAAERTGAGNNEFARRRRDGCWFVDTDLFGDQI